MRRRRGFTLIELLVVITIIAILAAIVMPVFHSAQKRARMAQCQSNLHNLAVAIQLYRKDYKRFPLGAVAGNIDNLPDLAGNAAYTAASYNTIDAASGRRTRINALYPTYIDSQKALICPDDEGVTDLVTKPNGSTSVNGQNPSDLLQVGADGSFSSYDDYYNVFGYTATATALLGQGTPLLTIAGQVGGGRKSPRLSNPYAPGNTVITYCRKHEGDYEPSNAISLIARLDGKAERVVRCQYAWNTQAESSY